MSTIAEQEQYQKRIDFYHERIQTCGYRFYDMIQTRGKEVPRLGDSYQDQSLQQEVEGKVLASADRWINCLRGQHYSHDIPEYLQDEANNFKSMYYTRLLPKFVLEDSRLKLLEKIFNFREGIL